MINVDISNIWGELSLQDLLGIEQEIFAAHASLNGPCGNLSAEAVSRVLRSAESIRADSRICVITGSGADFLEARAAVQLLDRNPGGPQLFFAAETMSTRNWNALKAQLEGKDVSVIALSGAGTEEGTPVLRRLKWMLERKYGTDECCRRIYTAASSEKGLLLSLAAAGIDIGVFAQGYEEAQAAYDLRSFENPVWLYTAVRSLMRRGGKTVELLSLWEPDCGSLGKWWQQCFLEGEAGLFSMPLECPSDLPALEQNLVQLRKPFFETMIRFVSDAQSEDIAAGVSGLENPDDLLEKDWWDTLEDHADRGVPIVTIELGALDAAALGWLTVFLKLGSALSRLLPQSDRPEQARGE